MTGEKICQSCGMPMRKLEDFGGKKPGNDYCIYCTDINGVLKPYETVLDNLKKFTIRTMGVSEAEALSMAKDGLSRMPAWKDIPIQ